MRGKPNQSEDNFWKTQHALNLKNKGDDNFFKKRVKNHPKAAFFFFIILARIFLGKQFIYLNGYVFFQENWDTKPKIPIESSHGVTFDKPVTCPFSLLTQWYPAGSEGRRGLMSWCADKCTISLRKKFHLLKLTRKHEALSSIS